MWVDRVPPPWDTWVAPVGDGPDEAFVRSLGGTGKRGFLLASETEECQ